jgi:hypothetical protein
MQSRQVEVSWKKKMKKPSFWHWRRWCKSKWNDEVNQKRRRKRKKYRSGKRRGVQRKERKTVVKLNERGKTRKKRRRRKMVVQRIFSLVTVQCNGG